MDLCSILTATSLKAPQLLESGDSINLSFNLKDKFLVLETAEKILQR